MSNHATNVVADNVYGFSDAQVLGEQRVDVSCHDNLGVAIARVRRVASAPVIWRNNPIARIAQRCNDMAELVRRLWEPMDQENDTLGLRRCRTINVVNRHFIVPRWRAAERRSLRDPASIINLSRAPDRHPEM